MRKKDVTYPIIDLFAGPGGLGEGFSELYNSNDSRVFKSVASIERDEFAHQTLLLRHFYKSFKRQDVPDDYYAYLEGRIDKEELIERNSTNWEHAKATALKISLGEETHNEVQQTISDRLNSSKKWALIGGPPCQAYSLVGRSRMMNTPEFEEDERHFLYKEYLKIIKQSPKSLNNAGYRPFFKPCGLRMLLFTAMSAVKRKVAKPEANARYIY